MPPNQWSASLRRRFDDALLALVAADRARLATLGRAAPSAWLLLDALQRQPVATARKKKPG